MYGFLLGPVPAYDGTTVAPTVKPSVSYVESICTPCETQWAGDGPCWACGAPGRLKADMYGPERLVWAFANGFSPNYELARGDPL